MSKPALMPSAAIEIDSTSNLPRHCPSAAASMCRKSTCLRRGREDASWTCPTAEQVWGRKGVHIEHAVHGHVGGAYIENRKKCA